MKRIQVVAAVILSPCKEKVFLARRKANAHQGGLWEFPGGKRETQESAQAALIRELDEELGIHVASTEPLILLQHDYSDKCIELDVYIVNDFSGEPHGAEGQEVEWVSCKAIRERDFPEANRAILDALEDYLELSNASS
ncbi:8-oxo-dGTP diphosphatase MutT [Bermanella marisrubri]|uniref:8-oxo-dGTP diphosphatase n=1 Tax=Bermanella marisrubri TaxID=207949 RepID=Q1MZP4_9GAMM|nr:8-oxo-dGTP diphosphatase MutT [Bermanella marisrubri]EAT11513.1 hypothetical protein RED65_04880 [Oceanobacter sp. RED65] [Bermanella marisrubri]QIZ85086.1 8-oxo-dGTP diphosphatase MutT [Bermanella marisrubri]